MIMYQKCMFDPYHTKGFSDKKKLAKMISNLFFFVSRMAWKLVTCKRFENAAVRENTNITMMSQNNIYYSACYM